MKKLVPYIAFACLTVFTTTSNLPVIAGVCGAHRNKTTKVKCAKNDTNCRAKQAEKSDQKSTAKS